jgi:hypothetical protein
LEEGLAQPLLIGEQSQDENSEDNEDTEVTSENSHEPATSIASAYRLLTPSVKVSFPPPLPSVDFYFVLLFVPIFEINKRTV